MLHPPIIRSSYRQCNCMAARVVVAHPQQQQEDNKPQQEMMDMAVIVSAAETKLERDEPPSQPVVQKELTQ